jgi:hypothetical protein
VKAAAVVLPTAIIVVAIVTLFAWQQTKISNLERQTNTKIEKSLYKAEMQSRLQKAYADRDAGKPYENPSYLLEEISK